MVERLPPELEVRTVVSQAFMQNSFLVWRQGAKECVVCDPGLEPDGIEEILADERLQPVAFLITHGHADHIAGLLSLKPRYPACPVLIGAGDAYKLTNADANLSAGFGLPLECGPADQTLEHGEQLALGGLKWEVRNTPGHSAGHVVFVLQELSPPVVLGGDVLFREGIGRTDFPDGSTRDLISSIQNQLFTLPEETVVLPGHGPATTIGHERAHNPFLNRRLR